MVLGDLVLYNRKRASISIILEFIVGHKLCCERFLFFDIDDLVNIF